MNEHTNKYLTLIFSFAILCICIFALDHYLNLKINQNDKEKTRIEAYKFGKTSGQTVNFTQYINTNQYRINRYTYLSNGNLFSTNESMASPDNTIPHSLVGVHFINTPNMVIQHSYDQKRGIKVKFGESQLVYQIKFFDQDSTSLSYYYYDGKISRINRQYKFIGPHGKNIAYSSNGQVRNTEQYLKGEKHGPSINYHKNSNPSGKYFYFDGRLINEELFQENGKHLKVYTPSGLTIEYHDNGNIKRISKSKKSKNEIKEIAFDKNGSMK